MHDLRMFLTPMQSHVDHSKQKKAQELQSVCDDLHTNLTTRGYKPMLHRIDNGI